MEGKINKKGHLLIKRADKLINQSCMQSPIEDKCGDHCPLFGEVEIESGGGIVPNGLKLQICQDRTLSFDKFSDERFE